MKNKVVVITGGSRGIGKETAILFAQKGYSVYFNYLKSDKLAKEVVETAKEFKGTIKAIKADLTKEKEVESFFEEIIKSENKIDILINNASITKDSLLLTMPQDKWYDVISTNLNAVFYCSKLSAKTMIKNRWGRIINISSVSGAAGNPGQSNYSASKSGVIGFTKSVAKELASRNITVNAVLPGFIETDMTKNMTSEQKKNIENSIPLKRIGSAKEVADLIFFLAGDSAAYITGQTIHINGGLYM